MVVVTSFDEVEKIFQEKMKKLFQKYDRPFLSDVLLDLEDFVYHTPEDRHLWNLSEKTSSFKQCEDLSPVRKLVPSDSTEASPSQLSKTKKLPTTSDVKQRSDQICTTLMRYKEDNPYRNDRKSCASRQNSDSSVLCKTLHVALSPEATVSEEMDDQECCLKYPGRYNESVCKTEDSGPLDNEEASFLDPGNKTLEDMYPQMIENLSRLWDFGKKKQAADNIVRYYKRHFWPKKKVMRIKVNRHMSQSVNRTYTISSAPDFEEIVSPSKSYNSRMLQEKKLSKLDLREPMKGKSPRFLQGQKFSSPVSTISVTINPQNNASKAFEGSLDNVSISLPSPFLAQVLNKKYSIIPPETDPFCYCKDSKHLQQNIHRRNSLSDFMSLCPKKVITRPNCYMSERTKSPSKAITTKSQMDIERNHGSYKEYTKQLQNRAAGTITRRNSFSSFPVSHSPSRDFESLYRNPTRSKIQPDLSLGKAQFQLSKTVYSLVDSPGSRRAKRPVSPDFSKKPMSATEYLFGGSKPTYKSMDSSDVSWVESSSSRMHHSIFASSVETHMLPYSPVLLRSFPRSVNDRCPLRTNARKLSYPENNGTVSEN
ncbi:uncharacterized protein LOC130368159 isoform X2 [Hyla sarda]|nr:uncharacterized protein LOC130368159 isoform X2 [Hyla sarda]XP_056427511.1 uncharacterized protein LOC130368159 isoform X2 [Hyla sarda]XP_056427512.1 uncharacterized protein LOC130368159 isoform X2 [Hyla sarda]XP_056427513.1 uncharacterized protein LOC130368159 isoform X2 [Hyla sarda]